MPLGSAVPPTGDEANQEPPPPLVSVNVGAWQDKPEPPREWAVEDRIPARNVTTFFGNGGTGKTLTAMDLVAAHSLAKEYWLGARVEPGPAMLFSTEDDEDEMHRRFGRIAGHYGASFTDLARGGLRLFDYVGKDAVLGWANRSGAIQRTPLLGQLHEAALDLKPKIFVIDSLAECTPARRSTDGRSANSSRCCAPSPARRTPP